MRSSKVKTVYLDINTIAAWFTLKGLQCEVRRVEEPVDLTKLTMPKVSYTFDVTYNGKTTSPLVPLIPYNSSVESISSNEILQAIEMTKATRDEDPARVSGKNHTTQSFLEALTNYVRMMEVESKMTSLFAFVNEINKVNRGLKLLVGQMEDANGPKGTPIVIAHLLVGTTEVAKVVCTGKGYSVMCTRARVIESLIRSAPAEMIKAMMPQL